MGVHGLTETSPLLTVSVPDFATPPDDWARRARAGVPGLGVEVVVLDPEGRPVPRDDKTVGEVCARSNVVMAGYWNDPRATAGAIRDGWFHTGDVAVWDEGGNIHIVDRQKDGSSPAARTSAPARSRMSSTAIRRCWSAR